MGPGLEFQQGVRTTPNDAADDLFVTAVLAGALAQHFDAPALRFGVAGIHAKQIARKDGSLIAARTGANLEKDVAVIMRILGHQQALQLEFLAQETRIQLGQLLFAHRAGRRVFVGRQFCVPSRRRLPSSKTADSG